MQHIISSLETYITYLPSIKWTDIVEILLISFLVYHIMVWIKNTKAWSLLKGVLVIAVIIMVAAYFDMNTILWITQNVIGVAVTAIVVILQPELRKALEDLGKKNIISSIIPFETGKSEEGRFSDKTIMEIVKASTEMGKVKTGALIVVQQADSLTDYERTGIEVDGIVTSQLLINIFEHNTPLHDGAVIISGNRVISATCYLPLSDSTSLSKELGTRHRAGLGVSEETDSLTIIVSEETGNLSVAYNGKLDRNVSSEKLKEYLYSIQNKQTVEKETIIERKLKLWKGRKVSKK